MQTVTQVVDSYPTVGDLAREHADLERFELEARVFDLQREVLQVSEALRVSVDGLRRLTLENRELRGDVRKLERQRDELREIVARQGRSR